MSTQSTYCLPCDDVPDIETRLARLEAFSINDSSSDDDSSSTTTDDDDDDDDDCKNCHACVLHRMLDCVPDAMSTTCCANHLTDPIEEQIELVKLMHNADQHKVVIMKARAQLKLIPRRLLKTKQLRLQSMSIIKTMAAATANSAVQNVLAAARERDSAAKRTANNKKKREKKAAAHKRAASAKAKAAPPPVEEVKEKTPAAAPAAAAPAAAPKLPLDDFGPDAMYCVVCLENVKNVLHVGCGHVATCSTCSAQLDSCPLCREPVTNRNMLVEVRVF